MTQMDVREKVEVALHRYAWQDVTPGGVIAWGDLASQDVHAFGGHTPEGPAVKATDIYDLASVTKPIAGALVAAKLISRGALTLDTPVAEIWPAVAHWHGVTIKHLLGHGSGLPAHVKFYESPFDSLADAVAKQELVNTPGSAVVYSDLGYITLGHVLALRVQVPLRALVEQTCREIGMGQIRYADVSQGERIEAAVPTQNYPTRGWAHGVVHDDNAFAGGGVFAHAGLFAPIQDVAQFARVMLALDDGHEVAGIAPSVVQQFFREQAGPGTWRLGWDTPSPPPTISNVGVVWQSEDVVGHLGFTGTSIWLNRTRKQYIVILTNRVQFSWDKAPIRGLRRYLMDTIADAMKFW